jgi:hypothetical protein
MSIVSEWLIFLSYGILIFCVGVLWTRKEKRDRRGRSSSQLRKNESSGHIGTDFIDNDRQL